MTTGLTRRFTGAFLPLLLAVLIGCAVLLSSQLDATKRTLREHRYASVAMSLASAFEVSLDLGVPLEAQRNLLDDMRFEIERDPTIVSIDVFDPTGRLVFTTDRGGVGDRVPAAWVAQLADAGRPGWTVADGSGRVTGASIINNFNKAAGAVALRHDAGAGGSLMSSQVVTGALAASAALSLLTLALLLRGAFRPLEDELTLLADSLDAGEAAGIAGGGTSGLAAAADGFRRRAATLHQLADDTAAALRRIDDEH